MGVPYQPRRHPRPVAADGVAIGAGSRVQFWNWYFALELGQAAACAGTVRAAHGSVHLAVVRFDDGRVELVDRFKLVTLRKSP